MSIELIETIRKNILAQIVLGVVLETRSCPIARFDKNEKQSRQNAKP